MIYFAMGALLLECCLGALGRPPREGDGQSNLPALTLKIERLAEEYCAGDEEVATLHIQSRLQFTNVGKEPLILHKGSGALLTIKAARTEEDLKARRFELNGTVYTLTNRPLGAPEITELLRPSPREFVILPPGGCFETGQLVAVPFRRSPTKAASLAPGRHFLQVDVDTWPESTDLGRVLQEKWKKWGSLWFQTSVLSEPLEIIIEEHPKIKKHCH